MFYKVYFVVFLVVSNTSIIASVTLDGLELVSQYKNATQSSNHGPGVATRAVDGGTNGNYFAHSCSHTLHGFVNPWWYVDLESPTVISKIVIYNRDDCCGDRLDGAVVSVGSDNTSPFLGNTQCGSTITGFSTWFTRVLRLTCTPAIEGRYISVYVPGTDALSLCELKAYRDVQSPIVICPDDIVIDSNVDQKLYPIRWSNSVSDNVDVRLQVNCNTPPGSLFDIGFTKVICSATDSSGNEGNCSFVAHVKDEQEPSLTCPDHITVGSNVDQLEDPVTWSDPKVTDNVHTGMSANCTHASGSIFDVGSTIVTCTATDGTGNQGSCSFVVHVVGQTYLPDVPTIMCPHDVTITTSDPRDRVFWNEPVVGDKIDTCLKANCTPPTGSMFDVGFSTVNCSVTNSFGNVGNCSFLVNMIYRTAEANTQGRDEYTQGYLIAVTFLSVVVVILASVVFIITRYYKKRCNDIAGGLLVEMEGSN